MSELSEHVMTMPLVDHHCHGIVTTPLDRATFDSLATEGDDPASGPPFDSPFGVFVRAECAGLLDLPRHCTGDQYWTRRAELGSLVVAERLLPSCGIADFCVDTGYRTGDLTPPPRLAQLGRGTAHTVVRLESLAEEACAGSTADSFAADFERALQEAAHSAVAFKTIIAYRYGLDFDPAEPSQQDVRQAAGAWLAKGAGRMDDPVLMRYCLWQAVRLRRPIQVHVGFGDSDITLHRCDPSLMSDFLRATAKSGASIMLLHCYPFVREAGVLAHVFPHVYLDTGEAASYAGASATTVVRESLEVAPFAKVLFSSDAFGLPELYVAGSMLWRRAVAAVLGEWVSDDAMGRSDATRFADAMGWGNARRVYGLDVAP